MNRLIKKRYVWPRMNKDVSKFCKNCVTCQQVKVSQHVKLAPAQFVEPDGRLKDSQQQ